MVNSNKAFLEKIENHIASNLNNPQFGVEELSRLMSMSRSNLHRKLKSINGKSTSRFIREYRLEKAKKLLSEGYITASEASYLVGFNSHSYFHKCYSKYFGYLPSKTPINPVHLGEEKSIIVLPFEHLFLDKEHKYLSEGMVEAISRHLSGIDNLKVFASSASNGIKSIKRINSILGVTHVVKGSLQLQESTVRIEIKIFEALDEKQLWAYSFDRKLFDLLAIQNEIAFKIAEVLDSKISQKEKTIITKRTSYDGKAYDNYLRGMYYMNHFEESKINKALTYFKKAISIDASITPAYAAMANFYHMKASVFSASLSSKEALLNAEKYLNIALKLDKDWHFNYTMKAFQLTFFHWNFEEAEKSYQVGLKAGQPLNYIMYRDFLQFENRHKEALEIALKINKNNPFYPNSPLVMSYYYNGMYKEGEAFINERLSSFPTHYLVYDNAAFFMLNTGKYKRAIELLQKLIAIGGKRLPRILSWMGAAYAKIGKVEKAKTLLKELKNYKNKTDIGSSAFFIAIIYSALNEKENALKWLKTAVDDREMEIPWLVSEPQFYSLHGLPKFDALVKQVGFRSHTYPIKL